jgi:hypothetical protein
MEPESDVIATRNFRNGAFSALSEQRTLASQKINDKPTYRNGIVFRFIAFLPQCMSKNSPVLLSKSANERQPSVSALFMVRQTIPAKRLKSAPASQL